MLPAKTDTQKINDERSTGVEIRPGSWWRLVAEDHALREMPAPDHGLVLMVSEVRVIDGEIHTLVLHPHPSWSSYHPRGGLKFLHDVFTRDFKPEPDGEALRETEIAAVMARVQEISVEMQTPPSPALLLEKQKAEADAGATSTASAPDADKKASTDGESGTAGSPSGRTVPAALLPSQDIVEAQKAVETRIAAFEAQKNWITSKTDELKSQMNLVAAYQSEKVNATLASISEETSRAEGLLRNVQTMRLFLGEDMAVTELLDGESADPSEPLTFMQRMLFLDEEIVINDLLEGFSDDQMDPENLADLFTKDFSLVERMLPYPRCAAIIRVRRNAREFNTEGMSFAGLFEALEIMKADQRVHILVRDGRRLNMITADETTSGAARFFPSSAEIDALFKTREYFGRESREILPDTVEYSDARAAHDQRALFYKRFLILMWGVHERTDVFGPFMEKGSNWLAATTHSERFRFVHDEEDVLTDGRPSIDEYVAAANARIVSGSRVVAYWKRALNGRNAPSLMVEEDYRNHWKPGVELAEDFSTCLVQTEKATLVVRAPAIRGSYGRKGKPFSAKVTIVRPSVMRRSCPETIIQRDVEEGLLCLDGCTLEEIDYYANSRAARQQYLEYAHLFTRARTILREEALRIEGIVEDLRSADDSVEKAAFEKALRLWRSGNKWGWPDRDAHRKTIVKIARQMENPDAAVAALEAHDHLVRGGIRSNGDLFAICDSDLHELSEGFSLPWLEERTITSIRTGSIKSSRLRAYSELDEAGEMTLVQDASALQAFLDRCAPGQPIMRGHGKDARPEVVAAWRVSRGLFDPKSAPVLDRVRNNQATISEIKRLVDGSDRAGIASWLAECYRSYRAPNNIVQMPHIRASLALAYAVDQHHLPRAWVIDVDLSVDELAWRHGLRDEVRECVRSVYAKPDKILERIDANALGVRLRACKIGGSMPLAARWQDHPCLSFETLGDKIMRDWSMPRDDDRIGWRQTLAARITEPDTRKKDGMFGSQTYSSEVLIEASEGLHVIAGDGAEDLLDICFEARSS